MEKLQRRAIIVFKDYRATIPSLYVSRIKSIAIESYTFIKKAIHNFSMKWSSNKNVYAIGIQNN